MKLYNSNLSPYASRVRMQVYAKGMKVEFAAPPEGGLKGDAYLAINPIGKVPSLVDGDFVLPESGAITAYLEAVHPMPALVPSDARGKAHVRLIEDIAMLNVMGAMSKLFPHLNPKTRNQEAVDAALTDMTRALAGASHFLGAGPYASGSALSLADCALAPALFFVTALLPAFGKTDPLGAHNTKLQAYWTHIQADPHAARVIGEMKEALAAMNRR